MENLKKQGIILLYLVGELIVAYAIVHNVLNLPNEYIILIAPVLIQLVKQTVKALKETNATL